MDRGKIILLNSWRQKNPGEKQEILQAKLPDGTDGNDEKGPERVE